MCVVSRYAVAPIPPAAPFPAAPAHADAAAQHSAAFAEQSSSAAHEPGRGTGWRESSTHLTG